MPAKDPARRKKNLDAWRSQNLEHVSLYNHKYYFDNRARILRHRDELKRQRLDASLALRADLRANTDLRPSERKRETEAGLPLGGRPTPADAVRHGQRGWVERALRGTPFTRRRPGRPQRYPGNRRQRHAAAQGTYRRKQRDRASKATDAAGMP